MKQSQIYPLWISLYTAILMMGSAHASTVVFSEDFTSTTLVNLPNSHVGGWYTPQTGFQKWSGSPEVSITTGALVVSPTDSVRSAGIMLAPETFPASGSYTLSFDVTGYSGESNNSGLVTVWLGDGYDLSGKTADGLIFDTLGAQLRTEGGATAEMLASTRFTSGGNRQSITFSYGGSGGVALFFGASTDGWPFPTVTYDNISLTQDSTQSIPEPPIGPSVPEPSSAMLLAFVVASSCLVRRRN